MTEHTATDCVLYLVGVAVFVLGAVGRRLGWPLLTGLADWLAGFAGKKAEHKDEKPDAEPQPVKTLAHTVPADSSWADFAPDAADPADLLVQSARAADERRLVALPAWLVYLIPLLIPIIQKLLADLAERLGRKPTEQEAKAVARGVWDDYQAGKLRFTLAGELPATVETVPQVNPQGGPFKSVVFPADHTPRK